LDCGREIAFPECQAYLAETTGKDFSRVKPTLEVFRPSTGSVITCPIAAFGIVRATPDLLASLRRNPVPPPGTPLAATFLKHADEQTVVGLAAVYQAIHNRDMAGVNFTNWIVVAAPCLPGRGMLVKVLKRHAQEGAWGVSPHLIPHHSLHALSGTVSQALGVHGPNFGVGGGPHAVTEAFMVAATLDADPALPGLWLVLTEYDPEFIPTDLSEPSTNGHHAGPLGVALALALVPPRRPSIGMSLHICPHAEAPRKGSRADWTSWEPLNTVSPLVAAFSQNGPPQGRWRLGRSGWLELASTEFEAENAR